MLDQDLVKNLRVQTIYDKRNLFVALVTNGFFFLYFDNIKVTGFCASQKQLLCMETHQDKNVSALKGKTSPLLKSRAVLPLTPFGSSL